MTKKEYLQKVKNCSINPDKVQEIEIIYQQPIPEMIGQILSFSDESIFFDDGSRMLSYAEIKDAQEDLHVEFANKGLIPVADCGDNDFIVYHFSSKIWSRFNIIDECIFKKKEGLEELFC